LRHGYYAGASFVVASRFDHQLLDRLISEPRQIAQKLSVTHEKGSKHLGKVNVHKQCPTFSRSSSLRKAAKAAALFASHDGQIPLCLQLSVKSFSAPHVSHLILAKPASSIPQSRYFQTAWSMKPRHRP
jgi:hypothetical protein